MAPLFDPSGGLRYHLTALLHARRLWVPHRRQVDLFLREWAPRAPQLVLIGPSGGYTLPPAFLSRFQEIFALEPDPVARLLFSRLHSTLGARLKFVPRPRALEPLIRGSTAVLFCNVLGQLSDSITARVPEARAEMESLLRRIELVAPWASFHDRLSCETSPLGPAKSEALSSTARMPADALARHFLPGTELALEHDAEDWWPRLRENAFFRYWSWQLRPDQRHVIEATFRKN